MGDNKLCYKGNLAKSSELASEQELDCAHVRWSCAIAARRSKPVRIMMSIVIGTTQTLWLSCRQIMSTRHQNA